jgi:D-alanyl-lipoteichoic acid acyltransferase DltB (MBOAT superfamily)
MTFESSGFVLFILLVVTVWWLLAPRRVAQKVFLLLASIWFYGQFNWMFVGLLAVSTVVNWFIGLRVGPNEAGSLTWVRIGLAFNLLLLGFFKYFNFFRDSLDGVLGLVGLQSHLPVLTLLLPVGISFYSFQGIAYVVDVHRGQSPRATSLLDFSLFMGFFLKLLSGPIIRGRDFLPQLAAPSPPLAPDVSSAVGLLFSGLFKRMILASIFSGHGVHEAFSVPENYSAAALWVSMVGYTIELYCDFSGYTDLMRGFALLMGFRLPDNFNHPYIATNVGDFWRRWHMTFSNWLRDFIYFPLGGSKKGRARAYFNLFMTMFVCGIWHGASWGFILWGSIHGVALAFHKFLTDLRRDRGEDTGQQSPARETFGWLTTFLLVCLTRIFFRTPDLDTALTYFRRMFDLTVVGDGFDTLLLPAIVAGLAIQYVGPPVYVWFVRASDSFDVRKRFVFWSVVLILLLLIRPGGQSANAYFGF